MDGKCDAIHKHGNIKQGWDNDGEEFKFTFWFNDDNVFADWYKKYKAGEVTKHQRMMSYMMQKVGVQ